MSKNSLTILGLSMLLLSIALNVFLVTRSPQKVVEREIIYEPEQIIVDRVIESEIIAADSEAITQALRESFDSEWNEIRRHLRETNRSIAALQTLTAEGTGVQTDTTVIINNEIVPTSQDLLVHFDDIPVTVGAVNLSQEGILSTKTYDLSFELNNIVTLGDNHEYSTISRLSLFANNQEYELPIHGQTIYNLDLETPSIEIVKRFIPFSPSLFLGLGLSLSDRALATGNLNLFLMSLYKKDRSLINWRFIAPGYALTHTLDSLLTVAPFAYNIGDPIPFLSDTWIYPQYGTNFRNHYFLITIGTSL
jgi:hypothetical protein